MADEAQHPGAVHARYRPEVDGLRAIAVLGVLVYHFFPNRLPGGFTGVDVFFVISGYLISGNILRGLRAGDFSLADFYERRVRRILPALLVVLCVTLALGRGTLFPEDWIRLSEHAAAASVFASNFLLWKEAGYFDLAAHHKPLLHLWSLAVEEQFYLVWPALLVLAFRKTSRHVGSVIGILLAASIVTSQGLVTNHPVSAFYMLHSRLWELLLGAALAWREPAGLLRSVRVGSMSGMIGLVLILVGFGTLGPASPFPGWRALLPTLGAFLIIASPADAVPNRWLGARGPVAIGLISYPLYLWHWPLFVLAREYSRSALGAGPRGVLFILSIVLAYATYRFVEVPIRRRHSRKDAVILAALLLVLGVGTGTSFFLTSKADRSEIAGLPSQPAEECLSRYNLPAGTRTYCSESQPGSPPDIVVLGDSHALALYPGVAAANPGRNVVLIGGSACPFLRDTRYYSTPNEANLCPPLIEAGFKAFGDRRGTFVLVSRLSLYIEGTRFGVDEGDTPVGSFDSPAFPGQTMREFFGAALRRDLRALTAAGHNVQLVLPVPEVGFNPRACGGPHRPGVPDPPADCALDRQIVEVRQNHRASVWDVVAELDSPRLRVLDPMFALCDDTRCFARIQERLMYADNSHLNKDGAIYVWSKIAPR